MGYSGEHIFGDKRRIQQGKNACGITHFWGGQMAKVLNASPSLGRSEWRSWEQPTFPLRMRALCNDLKSQLLADQHDPFSIQTAAILNTGHTPVSDESTWKGWWDGKRLPQSEPLASCERLSPGISRWLHYSEFGNPVQRHMLAMDAVAIEMTQDGDWEGAKFSAQARCLKSLEKVWSAFTKSVTEPPESPLTIEMQLFGENLPPPSFRYATDRQRLHSEIFELNPYQYEFSENTRSKYIETDKFALFSLMDCLFEEVASQNPWLLDTLIMDMASLIALMRTELVSTSNHHISGFGHHTMKYVFWNRLFWDHIKGTIDPLIWHAKSINKNSIRESFNLIFFIRKRYYEILRQSGIKFIDIYKIMQPIKVFGAARILDNIHP